MSLSVCIRKHCVLHVYGIHTDSFVRIFLVRLARRRQHTRSMLRCQADCRQPATTRQHIHRMLFQKPYMRRVSIMLKKLVDHVYSFDILRVC